MHSLIRAQGCSAQSRFHHCDKAIWTLRNRSRGTRQCRAACSRRPSAVRPAAAAEHGDEDHHDHPETGPATADSGATAIDTLSLLAVSGLWATYRQVERPHVAGRLSVSAPSSSAIRTTNDRPDALFQCSPALRYVYMLPGPPVPAALTASRAVLQAACLLPPVLLTGKHTHRDHAHLRDTNETLSLLDFGGTQSDGDAAFFGVLQVELARLLRTVKGLRHPRKHSRRLSGAQQLSWDS